VAIFHRELFHCRLKTQTLKHSQILPDTDICSSQSQRHIATDGRSVCLSWCRAPAGAHDQMFLLIWKLLSYPFWVPSLTRDRVCHYDICSVCNCRYIASTLTTYSQKTPYIVGTCLPRKRRTPIVVLPVFCREMFRGQLPNNAVSIHVTLFTIIICHSA
jgi:hypothetical protein